MAFNWIGKSADGKTVTLHRLEDRLFRFPAYYTAAWAAQNAEITRVGAVLDVETTGLTLDQDQIIEIGIRTFYFNRNTGEVLGFKDSLNSFQDPGHPLSDEIISLTGITDEMLKGQKIDWDKVNELLKGVQLIIAHNASFDRPFLDRSSSVSNEKIWGCSFKQINWQQKGFSSPKLDLLNIYRRFFTCVLNLGQHRTLQIPGGQTVTKQCFALIRHQHPPPRSNKQGGPQRALQSANSLGDSGLGQPQSLGGSMHGFVLGYGLKGFQLRTQ